MKQHPWQAWLERLYNLRRDKKDSHERPHKPVLLLAIIDLLDKGAISDNAIPLSDDLVKVFKRYFGVVRIRDDQPTIQNPFYFLSGDGFWELVPKKNERILYQPGSVSRAPSVAELRRRVAFGRFDPGLWGLLCDGHSRHQVREALIARYFPEKRDQLAAIAAERTPLPKADEVHDELPPGRDAAFRRTILEVYDYRCAACGIRVLLGQQLSLVQAAHLIPFGMSRNDKPNNGVALCPNHHWAMDQHAIAPCSDSRHRAGVWRVQAGLDDRIEGQKDLMSLSGRPLLPTREEKFYPAPEGLRWRCDHLTTTY
jgi:putative restriction endonuclease